jgi:hypothetical protein
MAAKMRSFVDYWTLIQLRHISAVRILRMWRVEFRELLRFQLVSSEEEKAGQMAGNMKDEAATAFLKKVSADRGEGVARACALRLEESGVTDFNPHDVLQAALDDLDVSAAKTGALYLAATRRCDS